MPEDQNDRDLLNRIARGDRAALSALFARHYNAVFRFVMRMTNNQGLAEEVANDVFLDVWRHASRFKGQSRVSTYLLAIARNKAISMLRKRRETPVDNEVFENVSDADDTPEMVSQKRSKSDVLRQTIDALPEKFKVVVDLTYYQELSINEVADVLSIPPDTVKTRLFRARKKLAIRLKEAGIDGGWP